MTDPLIVTPEIDADGRTARVNFSDTVEPIVWTMPEEWGPGFSPDASAEFAALAGVSFAMAYSRPLHVKGTVCPLFLSNLETLVENRVMMRPKYHKIGLSADQLESTGQYQISGPHIATISGGVDASYAVSSNFLDPTAARFRDLKASITVRGFDYVLGPSAGFDHAFRSVETLCNRYSITPYRTECNAAWIARKYLKILRPAEPYGETHTFFLNATLHLFSKQFAGAQFATDYSYKEEVDEMAWPSTSATQRLFSSERFVVNIRGADRSRAEKIQFLSENKLLDRIAVCLHASDLGHNCGQCLKCKRTILMCFLQGIDPGSAFPKLPSQLRIALSAFPTGHERPFNKSAVAAGSFRNAPFLYPAIAVRNATFPLEHQARRVYWRLRKLLRL